MSFVLRRNNIGPVLYVICSEKTPGAKPVEKPVEKPGAARFAHPLRGAEVLVAVRGPSPGEGGGNLVNPSIPKMEVNDSCV